MERPTHALLGDLTALHDATGLVIGRRRAAAGPRLVVANDDGGSIFATLEQGLPAHMGALRAAVRHAASDVQFAALAAAAGMRLSAGTRPRRAGRGAGRAAVGIELVDAVIDRAHRRTLDAEITALAATL